MATQIVCKFNKFGFCKFRESCRNQHIKEVCELSSCDITKCKFRHPHVCKYYRDFGRCKYSEFCLYAHIDKENISDISRTLNNKIEDLEINIQKKDKDIEGFSHRIESLEMKMIEQQHKSDKMFENLLKISEKERENLKIKIDTMERQFEETLKLNFKNMNEKIEKLVSKQKEVVKETTKQVNEKVEEDSLVTSFNNPVQGIKCDQCDFVAKTNSSLKTHKTKKHTVVCPVNFSENCPFCEQTFDNKREFKHHVILNHSSTYLGNDKHKCKECEFVAKNYKTLEVHLGKTHRETFECGLCEIGFDNLENLEIHLKTCEIYKCRHCQIRLLSISSIKEHIKSEHGDLGYGMLDHIKMNRNNPNLVTSKFYRDYQI